MSFKLCLIIPIYNHHLKLNGMMDQLRELQIPCIILDDGSDAVCGIALRKLTQNEHWIELVRFEVNRGKGAVVCNGLRVAHKKGYTHGLQIDGDGQHNINDIPQFIATANRHPNAVICGMRSYAAMPNSRRYGRSLTDVWVWINTLSLTIKDSMCGFRLYPLAQTINTLNHYRIGQRMDFDTDILVKLYWDEIKLEHIETGVVYQDDIVSHFNLVKDNIRISKMHTKHFFGMLLRAPRLISGNFKRRLKNA